MVIVSPFANWPGVLVLSNLAPWLRGATRKVVPPKKVSATRPLFPDMVQLWPTVRLAILAASVALHDTTTFCPRSALAASWFVIVTLILLGFRH